MEDRFQAVINLKLSLLGNGYVGKTSLRKRYLGQTFTTEYLGTLGADFAVKTIQYNNVSYRYQIWDIAGQPRFNQLRKTFFQGSQVAMILYDITDRESYYAVKDWANELWIHNGKGKIPVLIVGNKIDLRESSDDPLQPEDGHNLAREVESLIDFKIPFIETSARTGANVIKAFEELTSLYKAFYTKG
jgi:small GTP-binding protein